MRECNPAPLQISPQAERAVSESFASSNRRNIDRVVPSGRFVVPVTIGRAPPDTDALIATTKDRDTVAGDGATGATGATGAIPFALSRGSKVISISFHCS